MNQELHLVLRELENTATLATPDEVAAATAEAVESINDNRFHKLTKKLRSIETGMLDGLFRCELDMDGLYEAIWKIEDDKKTLFRAATTALDGYQQLTCRLDALTRKVDAFLASLSQLGRTEEPMRNNDPGRYRCIDCGWVCDAFHICGTGESWSGSRSEGSSRSVSRSGARP